MADSCETIELTKRAVEAAQPRTLPNGEVRQRLYFDKKLPGFGVCVGATAKTYFAQGYVRGRSRRPTIGRHGVFTVEQARREAQQLLAKMARGLDPVEEERKQRARGFTLRQALELCEQTLNIDGASQRTIDGYRGDIDKYLKDWLDRPLAETTREDAHKKHQKIAADVAAGRYAGEYSNGRKRKRTAAHGRHTADRAMFAFRRVYNRALRAHPELPAVSPTINVDFFRVKRAKKELPLERLHEWYEHVMALSNPIRRDHLLFTLHTGLRRGDATTVRWEHVDFQRRVLHLPKPKGGEERAFDLPLTPYLIQLLKTRKKENAEAFGNDNAWVFPAVSSSGHIAEPREEFEGIKWTPHDLRRWFITAAESLNVSPYAIKMLVNHQLPSGDVTSLYIQQEAKRLATVMQAIGGKLRAACKAPAPAKRAASAGLKATAATVVQFPRRVQRAQRAA